MDHIYTDFYERYSIAPRGCHPRDLIDHVRDIAKYRDEDPLLSAELVDRACRSYFLDFPTAGGRVTDDAQSVHRTLPRGLRPGTGSRSHSSAWRSWSGTTGASAAWGRTCSSASARCSG